MDELHWDRRFKRNFRTLSTGRGAVRENTGGDFFTKEFGDTVDVLVVYDLYGENCGCARSGIFFAFNLKVLPIARSNFSFNDALLIVQY